MLKNRIGNLPMALQKQFYIKSIMGGIFILLSVCVPIITKEFMLGAPCILLSIYLIVDIVIMLMKAGKNNIIELVGEVVDIEKFFLRKSTRSIWISVDGEMIKVLVKGKFKRVAVGDTLRIYLYDSTNVYDSEGAWTICNYVAIHHEKRPK